MAVTAELEALRRSFSDLVNSINTEALLPLALSRGLITERERVSFRNETDSYRRAEAFLGHLHRIVNGNREMFYTFVQILQATGQQDIASNLNDELAYSSQVMQLNEQSSLNAGERVVVPDELMRRLADLRFEFAKLLHNYKTKLQNNTQAQENFVAHVQILFRRASSGNSSFQSHYDTLVKEEVSLFNVHYLRLVCDILPSDVSVTTIQLVEQYEQRCQQFMNSTAVNQFKELFPTSATSSRLSTGRVPVILKLENSWGSNTIADLKKFVAMFGVHGNFLHLSTIQFGCIAVTWLCSTTGVKQLKCAILKVAESLQTMRVLQVFIGEELVLDKSRKKHSPGEYTFVTTPPARCLCKLCNKVVCEACQHNSTGCGNVFCKECVDNHKKTNAWNPCPSCKAAFTTENTVKDARMDNEVDDFVVKCPNKDNGCQWKAKLKYLDNHLDDCPYNLVKCTNGCNGLLQRRNLDRHLTRECPKRSHECSHCHEVGEHQYITGPGHLDTCPNLLIPCSMCPKRKRRCNMEAHEAKCRVEPVPCQYQSVGCTAQPRRQDIPQHNLDTISDHLQLAVQAITKQSTEIAQLRRIVSMGPLTTVILKMENVSKYLSAKTAKGRTWYSSKFFTNSTMGYTARLRVDFNGAAEESKFVSCYICVTVGEYDAHLEWPFRGTFTISILNHSESGQDCTKNLSSENGTQPSSNGETIIGDKSFIKFSELLALDRRSLYLKENTLFFKVTVDNIQSNISPEMWCIS